MIWLLSTLGWAKKALTALLDLARAYPVHAALIAALCLAGWQWHGKDKAIDQRDAARAETAKIITAQKQAKTAQAKADLANVKNQTERNKDITHGLAVIEAARRDAVADYARRNPVRLCANAGSRASAAEAPGVHPDPQGTAGPGDAPGVVAVTFADLDTLSTAAVRGATCTGFLTGLVDEGLAVAVD